MSMFLIFIFRKNVVWANYHTWMSLLEFHDFGRFLTEYFPLDFSNLKISILRLQTQKKSPQKIKVCFLCLYIWKKKLKTRLLGTSIFGIHAWTNGLRCADRKLGVISSKSLPLMKGFLDNPSPLAPFQTPAR